MKALTGADWLSSEPKRVHKWITKKIAYKMRKSRVMRDAFDTLGEDARLMGIIALLESGEELLSIHEAERRCANAAANFLQREYYREIRRQSMEAKGNGEIVRLTVSVAAPQERITDACKIASIVNRLGGDVVGLIDEPVSVRSSLMGAKVRRELAKGH